MLDGKKIYDTVENLTETYETRDPFRLCAELGAIVLHVPLVRVNGFYQRFEDQDIIYINQDLGEEEKRLVCAHELGHMILHRDINSLFLESIKFVTNKYEIEANAFAIQLLREDLNLHTEVPLVDWHPNNDSIKNLVFFE